jgi:hypothetical protein
MLQFVFAPVILTIPVGVDPPPVAVTTTLTRTLLFLNEGSGESVIVMVVGLRVGPGTPHKLKGIA